MGQLTGPAAVSADYGQLLLLLTTRHRCTVAAERDHLLFFSEKKVSVSEWKEKLKNEKERQPAIQIERLEMQ